MTGKKVLVLGGGIAGLAQMHMQINKAGSGDLAGHINNFRIFELRGVAHLIAGNAQITHLIDLAYRIDQPDIFQKILFHKFLP